MADRTASGPAGPADKPPADVLAAAGTFLNQFGATLGILTLYPPGHRAVAPAKEALYARLTAALALVSPLVMAFSPKEALLEGKYPVSGGPMSDKVREFAHRLGIAIISIDTSVTRQTFEEFFAFLLRTGRHLAPEDMPPPGTFAGITLSLVDYSQVMTSYGGAAREMFPEERNTMLWEALVSDFLTGKKESFTQRELLDMVSLMEDEGFFADKVTKAIGLNPDPTAIDNLGNLMGAAGDFLSGKMGLPESETLLRMKKCLLALPDEIKIPLMEIPAQSPGKGQMIRRILGELTPDDLASVLASSLSVETGAFRRMTTIFSLLSLDGAARQSLLPMVKKQVEEKGGGMSQSLWQQIQKLLSPSADAYVSESYGRLLDRDLGSAKGDTATDEEESRFREEFPQCLGPEAAAEAVFGVLMENLLIADDEKTFAALAAELGPAINLLLYEHRYDAAAGALTMIAESEREYASNARGEKFRNMLEQTLDEATMNDMLAGLKKGDHREHQVIGDIVLLSTKGPGALIRSLAAEGDHTVRRFLISLISRSAPSCRPEALKLLGDANWTVVRNMLTLLCEIGDATCIPRITPLLKHRERDVRAEAVSALVAIGSPESRTALFAFLDDYEEEGLHRAAVFLSSGPGRDKLIARLLKVIRESNLTGRKDVRMKQAMAVLGKINSAEAVPALRRALTRRRWLVRGDRRHDLALAAASALAHIGGQEAAAALKWGAQKGSATVAKACRQHLAKGDRGEP